jgi:hypothetical protein
MSEDRTRLSDRVRLGFLEVLEISVGIQSLLIDGWFPKRDITLPPRRAILVDDGERLPG